MKRLIISESEKMQILNMHKSKTLIINEEANAQTQQMLNLSQSIASEEGLNITTTEFVDPDNPTCVPQTGDDANDGIIARIWDWANNPENKGSIRQTIKSLKDAIIKAKEKTPDTAAQPEQQSTDVVTEQVETALITIGGVALGPSVLIAIGVILLAILLIALVTSAAGGKKRSSCKRRSRKFKKHGIDGMFM